MLTLQTSNPVAILVISWSCRPSLRSNFIAHLFQISIIVLSNIIGFRSSHGLIWLFSGSFENFEPVIISVTGYSIVQLNTALYFELDSNFVQYRTFVHIVCDMSLSSFFFSLSFLHFCPKLIVNVYPYRIFYLNSL